MSPGVNILADSGYRGLKKIHKRAELPYRKTKKNPLSREHKKANRDLMSKRVVVENVIGLLKRFKIISDRYRNGNVQKSIRVKLRKSGIRKKGNEKKPFYILSNKVINL